MLFLIPTVWRCLCSSLSPLTPSSDSHRSPSPRKTTPPHTPGDSAHRWENDTVDAVLPSDNQLPAFPDVSLTGFRHLLLSSISNPHKNQIYHVFNLQAPPTLLDTSALRSRAQLAKKRAPRTRPSRAARKGTTLDVEDAAEDWLYRDSTG